LAGNGDCRRRPPDSRPARPGDPRLADRCRKPASAPDDRACRIPVPAVRSRDARRGFRRQTRAARRAGRRADARARPRANSSGWCCLTSSRQDGLVALQQGMQLAFGKPGR